MKIAKFFSVIFGICGMALMVFAVNLALTNLNTDAKLQAAPTAAVDCSESLMTALASGDFDAARNCLYGRPELGADRAPADASGGAVWEAFSQSFSYTFDGGCYSSGSGICRDVTITALDLSGFPASVQQTAQALLAQKVADAEKAADMTLVYDEQWVVHQEVMDQIYQQAVAQALAQQPSVSQTLTLSLVNENGTWWVLPDDALLKVITGGM